MKSKTPKIPERLDSYSFESPVEAIQALRIFALPKETDLALKRVARHRDFIAFEAAADGRLHSSRIRSSLHYGLGSYDMVNDVLACCVKLKRLTAAQVRVHKDAVKRAERALAQYRAKSQFVSLASTLGIKLTKCQTRQLENPSAR